VANYNSTAVNYARKKFIRSRKQVLLDVKNIPLDETLDDKTVEQYNILFCDNKT
jgi:hypothetical protein